MLTRLALAAAVLLPAGMVLAQETSPRPKESPPQSPAPAQPGPGVQPTLDDLLGLPRDKPSTKPPTPAPDPNRAALDQKLTDEEVAEAFAQATRLMAQTADRLQTSRDTGIDTQRIQEDIIRKLDQIIAEARKRQSQSRSRSRSSSQDQDQQNQPDQQQAEGQAQANQQRSSSPAQDSANAPTGNDARLNPEVARGAAWGSLPARVRDALFQGRDDTYSAIYQKWTEAYYKRLAEEGR
jgi:DNA primase